MLKFKVEIALLTAAIGLFVLSSYFYSYQSSSAVATLNTSSDIYRLYGISLVGFGSLLTAAASISYSRKLKLINAN
jgi:hypothetical protein